MSRFVTTAIPYVNAKPHIGHALEYVQADAYVRSLRLRGEDVFFLTGTDDNALKNVRAAEEAGRSIEDYIAENAEHFVKLDRSLNVVYDDFIRTSADPRHRLGVEKLWLATNPKDLYKMSYRGYYCVGCEEFKTEKDLVNGECTEHPGKRLEEIEEENYFFRLSAYEEKILSLIDSDTLKIIPESRKNEITSFIRGGLSDFSVSRTAKRAKGWGIPVPNNPDQYLYVWYDALANYITGLGYADNTSEYKKYWISAKSKTHMIGKGINRFHTVYWPAMLLSAGVPLPTEVFVHGYITFGGEKMSKSVGNVIDPNDLINRYGADAVRYFLLRHVHPTEDSDLTDRLCYEWYTANLANGLGNLVARIMKLAENHLPSPVAIMKDDEKISAEFFEKMEAFRFNEAMDLIFSRISDADSFMNAREPYKKIKNDADIARKDIEYLVRKLAGIAAHLSSVMPNTAEIIMSAVRSNKKPKNLFPRL